MGSTREFSKWRHCRFSPDGSHFFPRKPESVFITGTSRGVGLGLVKGFLSLQSPPIHLFASCLDPHNEEAFELRELASSHTALTIIKLDVRSDADIATAVKETQRILGDKGLNLLINNAAINSQIYGIESVSREDLISHFDCNAAGPILLAKAFLPLLRRSSKQMDHRSMSCNKAAIINISSEQAFSSYWLPGEQRYSYVTSKSAITTATKMLSNELETDDILAVASSPGWVKTEMGGPDASITAEESAKKCLEFFATFGAEHNGKMFGFFKGSIIQPS